MSQLIIAGQDIESFLPVDASLTTKKRIYQIALEVAERIEQHLTLSFRYNGHPRLVAPASLYLQEETKSISKDIIRNNRRKKVSNDGSRRTIAMDALEVVPTNKWIWGWKSFHLDQIDKLELLDEAETKKAFALRDPNIVTTMLHAQLPKKWGFVRNWQHWHRIPLIESPSDADVLKLR